MPLAAAAATTGAIVNSARAGNAIGRFLLALGAGVA